MKRSFISLGLWIAWASSAFAVDHPCATGDKISGIVTGDGRAELFQLDGAMRQYGLAGIYTTKALTLAGAYDLFSIGERQDRFGRLLVHAFKNGNWMQGQFLEIGNVLSFGLGDSAECLDAMRKAEHRARKAKLGVWADKNLPFSAIQLELLKDQRGQFVVIEGKVISIGNRKKRLYLNFGQNWSHDFTVSVVKKGKGRFKGDLNGLLTLRDKIVQVRGVLEEQQGPLLRLFDEAQIEIIE